MLEVFNKKEFSSSCMVLQKNFDTLHTRGAEKDVPRSTIFRPPGGNCRYFFSYSICIHGGPVIGKVSNIILIVFKRTYNDELFWKIESKWGMATKTPTTMVPWPSSSERLLKPLQTRDTFPS